MTFLVYVILVKYRIWVIYLTSIYNCINLLPVLGDVVCVCVCEYVHVCRINMSVLAVLLWMLVQSRGECLQSAFCVVEVGLAQKPYINILPFYGVSLSRVRHYMVLFHSAIYVCIDCIFASEIS